MQADSNHLWIGLGAAGFAAALSAMFSGFVALGVLFAVAVAWWAIRKPDQVLFALLCYLPFEPVLLKFVPIEFFAYAKYASEVLIYLLFTISFYKTASFPSRITVRDTLQRESRVRPLDPSSRAGMTTIFTLFVIVLVASAIINQVPGTIAALGIRQIIRFMLLFWIVWWLQPSLNGAKKMVTALCVIAAIQCGLGLAQAVIGEPLATALLPSETRFVEGVQVNEGVIQNWDPTKRVFGTLGRYDRLGTFLALALLVVLALLYEPRSLDRLGMTRRWMFGFFGIGLIVLALTYSRSAWIGFVLGAALISLYIKRDKRAMLVAKIGAAGLVVLVILSGALSRTITDYPGQTLTERVLEIFSYERYRGEYLGLGRLYWIVQTPIKVVADSPFFGVGPGMYGGGAVSALQNSRAYERLGLPFGVYGTEGYIDNNWFSLWGETGTIGLALFIWLFVILGKQAWALYRSATEPFARALALGFLAVMAAFSFNGFLGTMFEVRTLAPYFWALAGMVAVLSSQTSNSSFQVPHRSSPKKSSSS